MPITKDEILANDGDPILLDRIDIRSERGRVMVRFGLGAELFIAPRDRMQLREQVIAATEDYFNLFRRQLTHYLLEGRRPPRIRDDLFAMLRQRKVDKPLDESFGGAFFRRETGPDEPAEPSPYLVDFLITRQTRLSFFNGFMPVGAEGAGYHFQTLLETYLRWCNLLCPVHGTAGFSLIVESGMEQNAKYAYTAMRRHPGFDFIDSLSFTGEVKSIHNRIKSINWLTALGDEVLGELGGLEAARAALEPDCTLHPFDGGVVVQAGPAPQLGDTYHGLIPERYRKVAHFTRPVRFENYRSSLFRVFPPLDGPTEARHWARRFD